MLDSLYLGRAEKAHRSRQKHFKSSIVGVKLLLPYEMLLGGFYSSSVRCPVPGFRRAFFIFIYALRLYYLIQCNWILFTFSINFISFLWIPDIFIYFQFFYFINISMKLIFLCKRNCFYKLFFHGIIFVIK